ncbi:carbamoyl-phosphate synthase large subunit [Candidatus Vidania fulgoroideorum]
MKKILLIGAGPILIGQACEFDYSGVQACKILKKKFLVYLINNNPATIMTDKKNCHKIFYKNLNYKNVLKIMLKHKIKNILPNVGGQTGINIIIELEKRNLIKKNNINILGVSINTIKNSENRNKFRRKMKDNKISIPISGIASTFEEAICIRKKIINKTKTKEIIVRTSYTLGGSGGGKTNNKKDFLDLFNKSLTISNNKSILIEESLFGLKELEFEVLIDKKKNFVIVCGIENIDEIGIHTGDSITISPIQTLSNKEIQRIRKIIKKIINVMDIKCCGINIQFSYNKKTGSIKVIEINPRVSRSSALASKSTGYPIAKVSTLLSIGEKINFIKKIIFNKLPAFYEPSMDYLVMKMPKFSNKKFNYLNKELSTQMKSVGEAMAINTNNESLFQVSLRSLEQESYGFCMKCLDKEEILNKISFPNESRISSIYESYVIGEKVKCLIDNFFLNIIRKISTIFNFIRKIKNSSFIFKRKPFLFIKRKGFADNLISFITNKSIFYIIKKRIKNNIFCRYKIISSCSHEQNLESNYIFSNYYGKNEITNFSKKKFLILGSGPNKIGQGIEFDYCCVHALKAVSSLGFFSIILNNNPSTVSTDYEVSDRLFFLPCDFEEIINLYNFEKFSGLILQFCGQISINLAKKIKKFNIPIVGTSINNIIRSENRKFFYDFIKKNNFNVPKTYIIKNYLDFKKKKKKILKFPLIVRPSFVLGGEDMTIIKNKHDLLKYFKKKNYNKYYFPITLDIFIKNCVEYDIDFIRLKKKIHVLPILKHVEKLGVHSGDSNCYISSKKYINKIKGLIKKIGKKFNIKGFSNIQIGKKKKKIYFIELNTRASRTIPFLTKSVGFNYIKFCILNLIKKKTPNFLKLKKKERIFYKKKKIFLKSPVFSFNKFPLYFPKLGPSMKSTGEIITIDNNKYKAYLKSKLYLLNKISKINKIFICLKHKKKKILLKSLKKNNNIKKIIINNKNYIKVLNYLNINSFYKKTIIIVNKKKILNIYNKNLNKKYLFIENYQINNFFLKSLKYL